MTRKKAILTIIVSGLSLILGFFILKRVKYIKYGNLSVALFKDLIDDISDIIIPRTNTPGAKDANVSQYIINVIENCTSLKEKRTFILELKEVDNYSQSHYSTSFSKCKNSTRVLILQHFENKGSFSNPFVNKIKIKVFGQSFYEQMKWLTVSGYCLSKLGVTKGMAYDHIPVDYLSCIPYKLDQRSWATK